MATDECDAIFRTCFDMAPYPALILDCDLVAVTCNLAYERTAHMTREAMVGRPIFDTFPGVDAQSVILRDSYNRVLRTGTSDFVPHLVYAISVPGSSGLRERHWAVTNIPLLDNDGTLYGILHCPSDITELTQLRQANAGIRSSNLDPKSRESIHLWTRNVQDILRLEKSRLQRLFQQAPSFIAVVQGPDHIFELANDAYYQLVGHREIIGRKVADVMPEVIAQGYLARLDAVYATGRPFTGRALPIELQRSAGGPLEQSYIDLIYQPIFDEKGEVTGIFAQGNDVTEAYLLAQEVTYQASHDSLTGLCNRREFARQTRAGVEPGSHALLYMDIDHLKIVNDRCGHAAGDSLLIQVASALMAHCDGPDDLLARLGGDEFALVRRNCSPEAAAALADRLCSAVKDIKFVWRGKHYGITLSVGVVNFGETDMLSFEAALGLADAACFLAKEKGRNRVQVSLETDEEVRQQQRDMDNVTRLKDAMREDRVILYEQRIAALQDAHAQPQMMYEVLARLREPDGTIIAPASFIPAAERFGIIEDLDRHIVRKTFAHLQAQPESRRDETCYFINLSGFTLSGEGFRSFVENALADCPAVRSSHICFQVTETAALFNVERTAAAMRSLIAMGFRFALDDFGSGMASFSYLSQLPVHYVKIDGEFVQAILKTPTGGIIVEAVATVARAMGMRTIAECVEFDNLIPPLKSMGIDYAQGHALQRPVLM